ncbi:TPA: DUF3577 domain-containing protein [Klebsiella variicola subsp. variicola]|uniref:STY4534 family ICE replication protein n=1 Tax=Klebsiella TaxID=570 RepID=UPI001660785C|nr:STY4534 family ICE replication protein [Klebsiella variicola]MBD0721901.1 DUF3577 domain-containing protein [Klebsiella variicola]HED1713396.1 DUF3577 domain-containing protein [Klebsiella variicola subsp. variicola]
MKNTSSPKAKTSDYFNLTTTGIGYLSKIRLAEGQNGTFYTCVVNALSGPTDSPEYTRLDCTVAGKHTADLIERCRRAVHEDKKVLINFSISGIRPEIFALSKGDHAGESRVCLRARLIKLTRIKIGQDVVYQADNTPVPAPATQQPQQWSSDSF